MKTLTFSNRTLCTAALLTLTLGAAPAHALDETHAYGVASFGGTGQCGSSDLSHSVHTKTAAAFTTIFGLMQSIGLWDQTTTLNNTSARGSYFTDSTKGGSCSCSADDTAAGAGADEGDVLYIHTHGNHDSNSSGLMMGNSSYDCEARTNQNMFFGNPGGSGDLDIAVIKACQSGDYGVWKAGGYRQQMVASNSSFTVWNAFHGDSSCGSHVTNYVKNYSLFSVLDGVGENWIDAAYDNDSGADSDDCPVSIVFGSSSAVRHNMFDNGGWADRKNTGTKSGSTYFFIHGCDPSSGTVLPN